MDSVLNEITALRPEKTINIDYSNSNPYCVILKEQNGSKTAYCFGTPVYNVITRKMVDMKFKKRGSKIFAVGSNAGITISDKICLENTEGFCALKTDKSLTRFSEKELQFKDDVLSLSTNGIVYKANCNGGNSFTFDLEADNPFFEIRTNNKGFSLMSQRFRPFVTVSAIGTCDAVGNVIAPAMVTYQSLNDRNYRLTVTPCSPMGKWVMFEVNLYEPKLFQDTTVESLNPKTNNAFGGTAFIGNTEVFGEQWLYSRPDFSRIYELADKKINKMILHLPKHNKNAIEVDAFKLQNRFCSFGTSWANKMSGENLVATSLTKNGYQSLDVTKLFVDNKEIIIQSNGFILKSKVKKSGFSAIATCDSYYAPQILEINFK